MAPSARWQAASMPAVTSSTTSPKRGVNPARRSSPSSTRRHWKKATTPPPSLNAQQWITRFGFDAQRNPAYLSLALGSGAVTPLQMVGGYAILANGGHRVAPYLVKKVIDSKGRLLAIAKPKVVGVDAEPVIEPRNAWLMTSLLRDVVRMGTATRAMSLGRADLAGKTGTTNDNVDAWFAGYTPGLVAVSWIGFDQPKSLGSKETGGAAALPIWIDYMKTALQGVPEQFMPEPEGIAQAIIDPASGRFAASGLIEYFYEEQTPAAQAAAQEPNPATTVETP
ncbi:MAG: hypothetical protein EBT54_03195 [Betaproteobacteria bacterium]|nr:hypothetical protein [Betaproteobacteria bacterium]